MRMKHVALAALALGLSGAPALAQEATQDTARDTARAAATRILDAIRLPTMADVLRSSGIPVEDVDSAIAGARKEDVPPGELAGIFEETARTVEETGPIDNFGAFVQDRLRAGLRGRDLAEAIRAEHARRGIGKGKKLESRGRGQGQGGAGRPDQTGRPDQAGGPDRGSSQMGEPPDSAGRKGPPMNRGQGGRPDSTPNSSRRRSGENGGQG